MIFPTARFNIDALNNDVIKDIAGQFMYSDVNFVGLDKCYEEATRNMDGTDDSELRRLFEDGLRLGIFLVRNEKLIPKI